MNVLDNDLNLFIAIKVLIIILAFDYSMKFLCFQVLAEHTRPEVRAVAAILSFHSPNVRLRSDLKCKV